MHGRDRRRDRRSTAAAASRGSLTASPSMANTPGQRQRDRPARHPRARQGHGDDHQRRPDRAQGRRRADTILRETLAAPEPGGQPVRPVLLIGAARAPAPAGRHLGLRAPGQPGRRRREPGGSTPTRSASSATAHASSSPTPGGNALDTVDLFGRVRNLAVFPNVLTKNPFGGPDIPMQAVPTSVAKGRDGAYYMTQLTGFPFPVGGANIWRVNPRTGAKKRLRHRVHEPDGPRLRRATARSTRSRSTTTACSARQRRRAVRGRPARQQRARSHCRAGTLPVPGRARGRRRRDLRLDQRALAGRRRGASALRVR